VRNKEVQFYDYEFSRNQKWRCESGLPTVVCSSAPIYTHYLVPTPEICDDKMGNSKVLVLFTIFLLVSFAGALDSSKYEEKGCAAAAPDKSLSEAFVSNIF